jgi:hypothetical protein
VASLLEAARQSEASSAAQIRLCRTEAAELAASRDVLAEKLQGAETKLTEAKAQAEEAAKRSARELAAVTREASAASAALTDELLEARRLAAQHAEGAVGHAQAMHEQRDGLEKHMRDTLSGAARLAAALAHSADAANQPPASEVASEVADSLEAEAGGPQAVRSYLARVGGLPGTAPIGAGELKPALLATLAKAARAAADVNANATAGREAAAERMTSQLVAARSEAERLRASLEEGYARSGKDGALARPESLARLVYESSVADRWPQAAW